ncbi:MAG: hypothetical protein NTV22_01240 [bacterium]|nr:hypothetical protein [bacterium]
MQTLTAQTIVQMFIDDEQWYGFSGMFEGTYGGRLLLDADRDEYVWLSDEEFDALQEKAEDELLNLHHQRLPTVNAHYEAVHDQPIANMSAA